MRSITTAEDKRALRARIRAEMEAVARPERQRSDEALFARFLSLRQVAEADVILLFHGMGAEPDTKQLIAPLTGRGKAVLLPRCLPGHEMEARRVEADTVLIRHAYGMLEPGEDCPLFDRGRIGLILVPGLAFDREGYRLGWGGGYYDRYLNGFQGVSAALCRERFFLPRVPREPHDKAVDVLVTETGTWPAC